MHTKTLLPVCAGLQRQLCESDGAGAAHRSAGGGELAEGRDGSPTKRRGQGESETVS